MTQSEKMEIITLVEQSHLSVKATLKELAINRSTFYKWYKQYIEGGYDGLASQQPQRRGYWNQLPPEHQKQVVELALERPELSCRELACYIVDYEQCRAAGAVCVRIDGLSVAKKLWTNYHTGLSVDGSGRSLCQSYHSYQPAVANGFYVLQDSRLGLVLPVNGHG